MAVAVGLVDNTEQSSIVVAVVLVVLDSRHSDTMSIENTNQDYDTLEVVDVDSKDTVAVAAAVVVDGGAVVVMDKTAGKHHRDKVATYAVVERMEMVVVVVNNSIDWCWVVTKMDVMVVVVVGVVLMVMKMESVLFLKHP
jgi:hypothetical protein